MCGGGKGGEKREVGERGVRGEGGEGGEGGRGSWGGGRSRLGGELGALAASSSALGHVLLDNKLADRETMTLSTDLV